ncbi:prepilin-type N-terminal cleavage/methylation domain-containing protein [Candidatus Desantisbacteria bacterium]|nr:prepilin-type N-terminal cleavage/methylation domain-containing protein [Candidatus Desantisbacteria bacterium]
MDLDEKGFTLIEILVASSIVGIVVFIIYFTFSNTSKAIEKSKSRIDSSQESRVILNKMEKEISSAFFSQQNILIRFKGDDGKNDNNDSDQLNFISTLNPYKSDVNESDLMEIGYYIKYGENTSSGNLIRRYSGTVDDNIENGGYEQILGQNIKGLNFRYYDKEEWIDSWDTNSKGILPKMVEIAITFMDDTNKNEYSFSTIVSIPLAEIIK